MTQLWDLIGNLVRMGGCVCSRESVTIEGVNYKVTERIAEGSFSVIDLVEHPGTRTKFALKRIVCHSTEDQIAAVREAEFHRHLEDHDGILRLNGSEVSGNADIVHNRTSEVRLLLDFYPRGTLHDELCRRSERKEPFEEGIAIRIFRQICEAVLRMHEAEPNALAHRDLKPHNVLLTRDLRPVVMDLGSMTLARQTIRSHAEAARLQDLAAERCSISYRPPELFQVNSRCEIDERTDVWSLGCILYAMCFYQSPYDDVFMKGDSVALAVQSRLNFPANSDFSTDMHNLITWMLTPEIAVRPHLQQIIKRLKDMEETTDQAQA